MFDRTKLRIKPLADRQNKQAIERDHVRPDTPPKKIPAGMPEIIDRIRAARQNNRPVMLAFGAHTIKNGLGPVLIQLIEGGWITHLATNGAGIIHDWEFAFQGQSSEDVRRYVAEGQFGIWEETGRNINLALAVGAWEGKGYGESVGSLIHEDGLTFPQAPMGSAAGYDLIEIMRKFELKPGKLAVPHPFKQYSIQAAAYRLNVPFTGHPMFGHDIIYTHPTSCGAAIGRCAERDFLKFANSVAQLDGGVYLSVGSAVMSPMVFEKSLSMVNNQRSEPLNTHFMAVVDLAAAPWDWQRDGEPPPDNPAYYLRYCKTFSRMGGTMRYITADNRDFLLALLQGLR